MGDERSRDGSKRTRRVLAARASVRSDSSKASISLSDSASEQRLVDFLRQGLRGAPRALGGGGGGAALMSVHSSRSPSPEDASSSLYSTRASGVSSEAPSACSSEVVRSPPGRYAPRKPPVSPFRPRSRHGSGVAAWPSALPGLMTLRRSLTKERPPEPAERSTVQEQSSWLSSGDVSRAGVVFSGVLHAAFRRPVHTVRPAQHVVGGGRPVIVWHSAMHPRFGAVGARFSPFQGLQAKLGGDQSMLAGWLRKIRGLRCATAKRILLTAARVL
mmetsp:Transcript_2749/g.8053  ORF Transcript_2749/g.8053 Transcript_2749/m.8053 type:complete len:273 (-) Transcript_2749:2-820(-)